MIARTVRLEQQVFDVVFDRDAIVRAALRTYVETFLAPVDPLGRHQFPAAHAADWAGDLQRGGFRHDGGPDYDVVAWTEAGVVGLASELGFGPLEQRGLKLDAVTGGPDDVRAAVAGLPSELEPAFEMAVRMLDVGVEYGEKQAGVGFWLHGDRVEGTLFEDSTAAGGGQLVVWGLLHDGRLPLWCSPSTVESVADLAGPAAAPIHAVVDAVAARALSGPTELTAGEIATLLPSPPEPERLLTAQRWLQKVGVTWPGLPDLPDERRSRRPSFRAPPTAVRRMHPRHRGVFFDRGTIVRAALYAYVENVLAKLDPQGRHRFPVCDEPSWTGDLRRGAFYNGVASGDYDVVAWTEAGVVALTYKLGFGPIEQLGLAASAVTGGPDDVRAALPALPAELSPALVMATGMLGVGARHGEKLASTGFWLHGTEVAGTFFDMPAAPGVSRLLRWACLDTGELRVWPDPNNAKIAGNFALWTMDSILVIVDAVVERALAGPTELTADELATLLPSPPDPERLLAAQRMLRKVGITWPGKHPS